MKLPIFREFDHQIRCGDRGLRSVRNSESGVTMVLVAIAMVAIIAMAALSVDVVTLYLAREEAQRSADAAALTAARIISISGMTGDPNNSALSWQAICGGAASPASKAAAAVGTQSTVGGTTASTITVTYSAGGQGPAADCSALPAAFAVNPIVTVQLQRTSLPTFFSRIWGNTSNSVSATATAEAFNPSNSGNVGNQVTGTITPVQPRCVKPWVIPNLDPLNPPGGGSCTTNCNGFVNLTDGHILNGGISLNGGSSPSTGVIGETFTLVADCQHHITGYCSQRSASIQANRTGGGVFIPPTPNLEYLPGQTLNASVAVPSTASAGSNYEQAIAGCDQTTIYQCGVQSASSGNPNMVDLSENPVSTDDTTNGVMALIHQGDSNTFTSATGQDTFNNFGAPSAYPFQILAGTSNPLVGSGLTAGNPITSSNSIVTVPIYDQSTVIGTGTTAITIIGFLQLFINAVDQYGNVNVTILNVAGCGNGTTTTAAPVSGSSAVPVRLITSP